MADQDSKEGIKQQDSDAKVSIVVRAAQYGDLNFNVKPEFKFEKLAKKWCQHQQLDPKTIRFLTEDGQRIQNNSLVKDLDLDWEVDDESGMNTAYIQAVMEQIGGGERLR